MEAFRTLALLIGPAWTSGINLYATVGVLGISHRMGWLPLPQSMETLAHPVVIAVAVSLYIIEFFADKIPWVDNLWDSFHTFIRPFGGAILGYMAVGNVPPVTQTSAILIGFSLASSSHLTKATLRSLVNVSPEPFSNIGLSLAEDALVIGSVWLTLAHPILLLFLVAAGLGLTIWLLPKLFQTLRKMFGTVTGFFRNPAGQKSV